MMMMLSTIDCIDIDHLPTERRICFSPADRGQCDDDEMHKRADIRWFYNADSGECRIFTFSGCEGNENNFPNERQCLQRCYGANVEKICRLKINPGRSCQGMETRTRYYYEPAMASCAPFLYAGCDGNQNHFVTFDECDRYCDWHLPNRLLIATNTNGIGDYIDKQRQQKLIYNTIVDRCLLQHESGTCLGNYIKWYNDPNKHRCMPFVYSGCEGNANRFEGEQECMATCANASSITCLTHIYLAIVVYISLMIFINSL